MTRGHQHRLDSDPARIMRRRASEPIVDDNQGRWLVVLVAVALGAAVAVALFAYRMTVL